ncbi:MAG TPA: class E sortase [Acidimicrobiales bacterium]|nr:class E sortase [Acidimicrobiales bacterium]
MLVELLRAKPWLRRTLSGVSVLLLLGGVALIGYPFATNVWQDRIQGRLRKQFASPQLEQAYRERRVGTGDSLTRLRIPSLDVDVVVVEGTTPSALRAGAGHYADTSLPCDVGNVAIAGHRTTFGKPFVDVDRLKPGDVIELTTPIGGCVYEVSKPPYTVNPRDLSPLDPTPDRALPLTTCHPKGSAAERLIVRATWSKDLKAA